MKYLLILLFLFSTQGFSESDSLFSGLVCEDIDGTNYNGFSPIFKLRFNQKSPYLVYDTWYTIKEDRFTIEDGDLKSVKLHSSYIEIITDDALCFNVINKKTLEVIRGCDMEGTPDKELFWKLNQITSTCKSYNDYDSLEKAFTSDWWEIKKNIIKNWEGNPIK
tara:strand:- start:2742 stop:3233 length:492 start_codon:yes stop_codon:yes gene_type:complete